MSAKTPSPFNVRCAACEHVWTAAWLPIEAMKFATLTKNLHCPNCGNGPKKIYAAPRQATVMGRRT